MRRALSSPAAAEGRDKSGRNDRDVSGYDRALLYLSLGNHSEAIRWLEKSIVDYEGRDIAYIKVEPLLDPLRGDPRFEALVQKVVGTKH